MAYGRKYHIQFKNVQNDLYHIFISEKDYEGGIYELRAATDRPFETKSQSGDEAVFTAIRAKECALSFVAENGISLLNFYSEDDEQFRIDFYVHEVEGVIIDKLLNSFYLVQDNCQQDFAAEPFEVSLGGTDNIALLKDVPFTTEGMPYHTDNGNYLGDISLFDYIKIAIQQTGLADLPLRIYSNIFENTTDDRGDDPTAEMFQQIFMNTGRYVNDEGSWQDLYTILTDILTTFNCCLAQENGAWNIFRRQESYLFTDNKIPGVEHNLTTGDKTAIELDFIWPIAYVQPTANFIDKIFLDKADHKARINRPFEFAKETFNYTALIQLKNTDLQLPFGAVPFETIIDGDRRIDRYPLSTYFPDWIQRNGDTSFLEVVTDISVTPEQEIDRYINKPPNFDVKCGVQFNPIFVSENDSFTFSLLFDTLHDDGFFWVYFRLLAFDGTCYSLNYHHDVDDDTYLQWDEMPPDEWYSEPYGIYAGKNSASGQWTQWSMFAFTDEDRPILIPADGILLIEVDGNSHDTAAPPGGGLDPFGSGTYTTYFKDITLNITQYVNESSQISGHYHNNKQVLLPDQKIKNNYDEEIKIDDSPRHSIAGTLLTNETTDLNYTDTETGEETGVIDVHSIRTHAWHRANINEERRLGEIIVFERMHQAFKARTAIEGTLYGLRHQLSDDSFNFVSLLCLLTLDSLPNYNFIFGMLEVDWMNANVKAVLNELYQTDADDEPFDYDYIFSYIYKTD